MKSYVKLFLISLLCLSACLFGLGFNIVSYANERVIDKIEDKDDSREVVVDFMDLPSRNRSYSEFNSYYSDFAVSDLTGSYCYLYMPSDYDDALDIFYRFYGSYGTGTFSINNIDTAMLFCYGNVLNSAYNIIGVTMTHARTGTAPNFVYTITYRIRVQDNTLKTVYIMRDNDNNSITNAYAYATYYIADTSGNVSNNYFFSYSIPGLYSPMTCMFVVSAPIVTVDNTTIQIDSLFLKYNNYSNPYSYYSFCVNSYQIDSDNTSYPIAINNNVYQQTILINSVSLNPYTDALSYVSITIPLSSLTVNHGSGYVLYISLQSRLDVYGNNNYYYGYTLPVIYSFGGTAPIPLSTPVLTISDNVLSWSSVPFADYYNLKRTVDGVDYIVELNSSLTSYVVSVNGVYSIQACSYSGSYLPSSYSNTITVDSFADTEYSFLLLISAIMDSILLLFKSFLNYNVLGINMFGAFGVILFILLILAILKFIRSK